MNSSKTKNGVAVLTNPATQRVEYVPLNNVKVTVKSTEMTVNDLISDYLTLENKVTEIATQLTNQKTINSTLINAVDLINQKLSIVETDVDTLNSLNNN